MRLANESDSGQLLTWRNNESVRRFSRNSEEITLETHKAWIAEKILTNQEQSKIFIFLQVDSYVGMTRLDALSDGCVEISILVDPLFQGKGIGSDILQMTIEYALNRVEFVDLVANIHVMNVASEALFRKLGFTKTHKAGLFNTYKLLKKV